MSANLGMTGLLQLPVNARLNAGDFSGDGRVGLSDILILRNNLPPNPSPSLSAPVVPEPASACSVALIGLAILARRAVRSRRLTV
jgi:hypothetical protein